MANIKTITEADAVNFPVVAEFVGKHISSIEWYKAISGEAFVCVENDADEDAEDTEDEDAEGGEADADNAEGDADAKPKAKKAKKGKK